MHISGFEEFEEPQALFKLGGDQLAYIQRWRLRDERTARELFEMLSFLIDQNPSVGSLYFSPRSTGEVNVMLLSRSPEECVRWQIREQLEEGTPLDLRNVKKVVALCDAQPSKE